MTAPDQNLDTPAMSRRREEPVESTRRRLAPPSSPPTPGTPGTPGKRWRLALQVWPRASASYDLVEWVTAPTADAAREIVVGPMREDRSLAAYLIREVREVDGDATDATALAIAARGGV